MKNNSLELIGYSSAKPEEAAKIKNDEEMLEFLRNFIVLTETPCTPYKYKRGKTYAKKAHYINGKKVNRQVYGYVKRWLMREKSE